jgi:hypothetical protein
VVIKRILTGVIPAVVAALAVSGEADAAAYHGYTVSNAQYVRIGNTHMLVFGATKAGQTTYMWASDASAASQQYVKDFVFTAMLTNRKISVQCGVANGTACDFSSADIVWGTQVLTGIPVYRVGTLKFEE